MAKKSDKTKPSPQLDMNTAPELSPKLLKTVKSSKKSVSKPAPEIPPEEPPAETVPATDEPPESIIEDPDTDKAVADIVIREGDTQLAVEDAIAERKAAEAQPGSSMSGYWVLLFLIIVVGTAAVVYLWFR